MNGELAELVALIAYGNLALHGQASTEALESSNSTFKFVNHVAFSWIEDDRAKEIAVSVNDWFHWLRQRDVGRLRLAVKEHAGPLPGHVAVAFAGAGEWAVLADEKRGAQEYWVSRWSATESGSARPWSVLHLGRAVREKWPHELQDIAMASHRLDAALRAAEEVGRLIGVGSWAQWFADAREQLASDRPIARFHNDAVPAVGYGLSARRLFAGAVGAWVFGGMGSWNDLYVDDPSLRERYNSVSEALFRALLGSLAAVLDSWDASGTAGRP